DTCTLLACDFDEGSWVLDALAYLDACHAHGVPAALERSRSGNGGHVWIFFETPVPASEARGPCRPCGQLAARAAGVARADRRRTLQYRLRPGRPVASSRSPPAKH